MDWNEAVRYGLIDKVLEQRGQVPVATPENRPDLPYCLRSAEQM